MLAPTKDLLGRTTLVTGANAGLGYQTALQLAQRGAHVVLGCRSNERGEAAAERLRSIAPDAKLDVAHIDLGDLDSVRAFPHQLRQLTAKLDFLCNNAGVIAVPLSQSPQGFELHMATNFFGPFLLTGLLLPLMETTPGARIVNVSSQIHRMAKLPLDDLNWQQRPYKAFGAYAQSKLAVTAYTTELHRRLQRKGVDIMALTAHPGFSQTDVPANGWFLRVLGSVLKPVVNHSGLVQSAAEGAKCSMYALTSPTVQGGNYIGPDNWLGSSGAPARATPSPKATDPVLGAALWQRAAAATGFDYLP